MVPIVLAAILMITGTIATTCGHLTVNVFKDSHCKNVDAELTKEWQQFYDSLPLGECNDQGSDAGTSFKYTCDSIGFHTTYFGDETCGSVMQDNVDKFGVCTQSGKVYTIMETTEDAAGTVVKEEPCDAFRVTIFRDSHCEHADVELTREWQEFYENLPTGKCNDQGSDAGTSFRYTCDAIGFHTKYFGDETCGTIMSDDVDKWATCEPSGKIFMKLEKAATMIV